MRIVSRTTLLFCLCLWIPSTALSQSTDDRSVDEETSGDDPELSGSGSGDDVSITEVMPTVVATQPTTNMTKTSVTIWVTEAPVKLPEQAVTQLSSTVMPQAGVESASPSTKTPLLSTTNIPETPPSPTSVKSFIHVKDILEVETTTVQRVEQETPDTVLEDENLAVLPVTTQQPATTTTPENLEEETTFVPEYEYEYKYETAVPDDIDDQSTDAPMDMETTPLPLATTTANDVAEHEPETTEASGEPVESTTVQAIVEDFIDTNLIPEVNREIDTSIPDDGDDFNFDEVPTKKRAKMLESEFALGASTDGGSLLERTEVLAGVIAGGLVGLAFAIMLVALMVYRMKKKDEGSYSLDEHKHPNGGYQKPVAQDEFLA